jgi:menaquinol-cytochrome c reductase iron-sulfur subunit
LSDQKPDRRAFYLTVIYGLWGLISAAIAVPAAVYLFFPPRAKKGGEWVEAADLTQLKDKEPEEVVFRRNRVDGWKVTSEKSSAWLVKMSDKEVIAFAPQCTHLGCAYHWDERRKDFICPCHTSAFSIDGQVLGGPAPRPLDRYAVKLNGSKILLGTIERSEA